MPSVSPVLLRLSVQRWTVLDEWNVWSIVTELTYLVDEYWFQINKSLLLNTVYRWNKLYIEWWHSKWNTFLCYTMTNETSSFYMTSASEKNEIRIRLNKADIVVMQHSRTFVFPRWHITILDKKINTWHALRYR